MTESEAIELRQAAWRINRLCAALLGESISDAYLLELLHVSRESAARLREMAGPEPICRGNGG